MGGRVIVTRDALSQRGNVVQSSTASPATVVSMGLRANSVTFPEPDAGQGWPHLLGAEVQGSGSP